MNEYLILLAQALIVDLSIKGGSNLFVRIFNPSKTYTNRLRVIIDKTVVAVEYELQIPRLENDNYAFYQSQQVVNELLRFRLDKDYNPDKLLNELRKNKEIIPPSKRELDRFIEIFDQHLDSDKEVKSLFINENYREKIFELEEKLDSIFFQILRDRAYWKKRLY